MIVDKIELDEDEKSISDYYNKNTMRTMRNESRKKIEKVNKYKIFNKLNNNRVSLWLYVNAFRLGKKVKYLRAILIIVVC